MRVLGPHAAVPGGGGGAAYGQMPMGGGYPPFSAGQGAMAPPQVTPGSSYGTRSAGTPSGYGSDGGGSGQGYGSRSSRGAGTAPPAPRSSGGPLSPPSVVPGTGIAMRCTGHTPLSPLAMGLCLDSISCCL